MCLSCTDRWAGWTRPLCPPKTNGALSRGSVYSLEGRFSPRSSHPASPTQRLCFLSPFYAPQHLAQSWAHHRMCPKSIFEKSSESTLELPWPCVSSLLGLAAWPWATPYPTRQAVAMQHPPPGLAWPASPQVLAQPGHSHAGALFPELASTPCSPQSRAYKGQRGASGHGSLAPVWVPMRLPPAP